MSTPKQQYFVTAEVLPDRVEIIRIEATPTLEHAHDDASSHVMFLRRVNQRRAPFGEIKTLSLLQALAAWPMPVLTTIAGSKYGYLGNIEDMQQPGLRPLGDDDADGLVPAVNRCALNEAVDDDRILLARKGRRVMIGPCELVPCVKHPDQAELHRWTWDVPSDGDHRVAIECSSDADIVSSCSKCYDDDARI